jgi:hypothetical protein
MKNHWPQVTSNGSQKQIVIANYFEQSHVANQNGLQLPAAANKGF